MKAQLTQEQIDNGSEILAVYMGWEITRNIHGILSISTKDDNEYDSETYVRLNSCWRVLHEVWEKLRTHSTISYNKKDTTSFFRYRNPISTYIQSGTKQQTFTALVECVTWLNTLK